MLALAPGNGTPVESLDVQAFRPGIPLADPLSDGGLTAKTDINGRFSLCAPAGEEIYLGFVGGNSIVPPAVSASFVATDGGGGLVFWMLSPYEIYEITDIQVGIGVDAGQPIVLAAMESQGHKCGLNGWQFALRLPDGGPLQATDGGPGYRVVYFEPDLMPDSSLSATTTLGMGLLYNIEVDAGVLLLDTFQGSDAGTGCAPLTGPVDVTGNVEVGPDILTTVPVPLP